MKLHLGSELVKLHLGRQSCKICPITTSSVTFSQFPYYQDQQEILLAHDTSILITAFKIGDQTDLNLSNIGFDFEADCDLEVINNNAHWGSRQVHGDILADTGDTVIHFYDINLYTEQGYQEPEVLSNPEQEALYIQQYGTYLGSIQLTPEGYWQITKG